jgi:hypothetical protein
VRTEFDQAFLREFPQGDADRSHADAELPSKITIRQPNARSEYSLKDRGAELSGQLLLDGPIRSEGLNSGRLSRAQSVVFGTDGSASVDSSL